jgi:hypothetical protein
MWQAHRSRRSTLASGAGTSTAAATTRHRSRRANSVSPWLATCWLSRPSRPTRSLLARCLARTAAHETRGVSARGLDSLSLSCRPERPERSADWSLDAQTRRNNLKALLPGACCLPPCLCALGAWAAERLGLTRPRCGVQNYSGPYAYGSTPPGNYDQEAAGWAAYHEHFQASSAGGGATHPVYSSPTSIRPA